MASLTPGLLPYRPTRVDHGGPIPAPQKGLTTEGAAQPARADALWTRDFILLIAANLALFFGFYLLLPTLPVYAVELGGGESAAGLVVGLFTIAAVIIRPFAGWALDAFGRRLLIALALLVFVLNVLGYNWAATIFGLMVLRFVHGFSWGVATTGMGALAADLIPKPRLAEGMGYSGMAATIAMGLAPAAALTMTESLDFTPLFVLSSGVSALALLLSQGIRYPELAGGSRRGIMRSLVASEALPPSVAVFFVATTYGAMLGFVALHAATRGVTNVGLFFTLYAAALAASRPVAGRLSDRRGFSVVVLPALLLLAVAMVILASASGLPLFLLAAIVYGVGFGAVQPSLQALSVYRAPAARRGAASATFFSAFDLGIAAGSTAAGFLAGALGYRGMFLLYSMPPLLALLVFWLFRAHQGARAER